MTAHIYTFPISHDLSAARQVMANPADHPADVVDTAVTVLDWMGTDADRARIAHLPDPGLVTGRFLEQLAEARRVGAWVKMGKTMSLPQLETALEVLETHGQDAADASLALQIEAAAMLARMKARKAADCPPCSAGHGTIHRLIIGAAAMVAAVWAMLVGVMV